MTRTAARVLGCALAVCTVGASGQERPAATQAAAETLTPTGGRGLTEVHGLKVGHHTLTERPTGCTVILVDGDGAVGGVSQRGGAPGTRETDLLNPLNMVDQRQCRGALGRQRVRPRCRAGGGSLSRRAQHRMEGRSIGRGSDRPCRDPF